MTIYTGSRKNTELFVATLEAHMAKEGITLLPAKVDSDMPIGKSGMLSARFDVEKGPLTKYGNYGMPVQDEDALSRVSAFHDIRNGKREEGLADIKRISQRGHKFASAHYGEYYTGVPAGQTPEWAQWLSDPKQLKPNYLKGYGQPKPSPPAVAPTTPAPVTSEQMALARAALNATVPPTPLNNTKVLNNFNSAYQKALAAIPKEMAELKATIEKSGNATKALFVETYRKAQGFALIPEQVPNLVRDAFADLNNALKNPIEIEKRLQTLEKRAGIASTPPHDPIPSDRRGGVQGADRSFTNAAGEQIAPPMDGARPTEHELSSTNPSPAKPTAPVMPATSQEHKGLHPVSDIKGRHINSGSYVAPHAAMVNRHEIALIGMQHSGITNAQSQYPVLGTSGLGPCTGLALYNPVTKTVGMRHNTYLSVGEFEALLSQVQSDPAHPIEAHIIGAGYSSDTSAKYINAHVETALEKLISAVQTAPRVTLRTCDVWDKPHPIGFAVDARNGQLIRGSPDITDLASEQQVTEVLVNNHFAGIPIQEGHFNGVRQKMPAANPSPATPAASDPFIQINARAAELYDSIRRANYPDDARNDADIAQKTGKGSMVEVDYGGGDREKVEIRVAEKKGWHQRYVLGSLPPEELTARISINAYASPALIEKLDHLCAGYGLTYKVPDSLAGWQNRHDPITIYLPDDLAHEIVDQIKATASEHVRKPEASSPHTRPDGLIGTEIAPGISLDRNPTEENIQDLIKRAEKAKGAEFAKWIEEKAKKDRHKLSAKERLKLMDPQNKALLDDFLAKGGTMKEVVNPDLLTLSAGDYHVIELMIKGENSLASPLKATPVAPHPKPPVPGHGADGGIGPGKYYDNMPDRRNNMIASDGDGNLTIPKPSPLEERMQAGQSAAKALPTREVILASINDNNLLGVGGNSAAYKIDGHPDLVLKVPKRIMRNPDSIELFPSPQPIEHPGLAAHENFGQPIAAYGPAISLGKIGDTIIYGGAVEVVKLQAGVPVGVPVRLRRDQSANQLSNDQCYEASTKMAAEMPAESYEQLLRDIKRLDGVGRVDPSKADNLLFDVKNKRFNLIDVGFSLPKADIKNPPREVIVMLFDTSYAYRYKGENQEQLKQHRKIILDKFISAAEKLNLSFDGHFPNYALDLAGYKEGTAERIAIEKRVALAGQSPFTQPPKEPPPKPGTGGHGADGSRGPGKYYDNMPDSRNNMIASDDGNIKIPQPTPLEARLQATPPVDLVRAHHSAEQFARTTVTRNLGAEAYFITNYDQPDEGILSVKIRATGAAEQFNIAGNVQQFLEAHGIRIGEVKLGQSGEGASPGVHHDPEKPFYIEFRTKNPKDFLKAKALLQGLTHGEDGLTQVQRLRAKQAGKPADIQTLEETLADVNKFYEEAERLRSRSPATAPSMPEGRKHHRQQAVRNQSHTSFRLAPENPNHNVPSGTAFAIGGLLLGQHEKGTLPNVERGFNVAGLVPNTTGGAFATLGQVTGIVDKAVQGYQKDGVTGAAAGATKQTISSVASAEIISPGATAGGLKALRTTLPKAPAAIKAAPGMLKQVPAAIKAAPALLKGAPANAKNALTPANAKSFGAGAVNLAGRAGLVNSVMTLSEELSEYAGGKEMDMNNVTQTQVKTLLAADPVSAITFGKLGIPGSESLKKAMDEINTRHAEIDSAFKPGRIPDAVLTQAKQAALNKVDVKPADPPPPPPPGMMDYQHLAAIRHQLLSGGFIPGGKIDGKDVATEFNQIDFTKAENYMAYRTAITRMELQQEQIVMENSSYIPRWLRFGESADKQAAAQDNLNMLHAATEEFRDFENRMLQYKKQHAPAIAAPNNLPAPQPQQQITH